jgi:hypothetical protein
MPSHSCITSLLIVAGILSQPVGPSMSSDQGELIATADIVKQEYCSTEDKLFSVALTVHVKFENRTGKTLILDKQIGKYADREIIAKSAETLEQRDYESDPIFDSFGLDKDPPHFEPSTNLLHSNFFLLQQGQSFERNITLGTFAWYTARAGRTSALNEGGHVLQIGFSSWNFKASSSTFAEAWRRFGNLVTEEIYTQPVDFQIPKNPKIDRTCN